MSNSAQIFRLDPRKQQKLSENRLTRKRNKIQYIAPEAPRIDPKLTKAQRNKLVRKEFTVAAHANIFDHEGVQRFGGEGIMLTEEEARFYTKLNYIDHEVSFKEDLEKDAEIERLRSELAKLKRETQDAEDQARRADAKKLDDEAEIGAEPDTSGGGLSDEDLSAVPTQAAGKSRRGRL